MYITRDKDGLMIMPKTSTNATSPMSYPVRYPQSKDAQHITLINFSNSE